MQTDEVNTEWVRVWAVNATPAIYQRLRDAAGISPDMLHRLVERVWRDAVEPSPEFYQARDMSDDDYGRVDWQEIADDLLG